MNYAEAVAHLQSLGPELAQPAGAVRRKFDLASMRRLCAELGDPQAKVPSVLIAGTNGKGSTAATLASILTQAGYRTGLYTSPHLSRVNERIQLGMPTHRDALGWVEDVGGRPSLRAISDEEFARLYTLVDRSCEQLVAAAELPHLPSFFERLTAMAFVWFAGTDVQTLAPRADVLVLEVGLGGRLDATNIVEPMISIITDISLDHQDYLGNTITEIANEKCGILRQNGILVTLSQHPEANEAIGLTAGRLSVRGVSAAPFLPAAKRNSSIGEARTAKNWRETLRNRYSLFLHSGEATGSQGEVLEVDSPLFGSHQQRNIALAIATSIELRNLFRYEISNEAIERGVRCTRWPGRLEWVEPNLLLDVAHNPAGAWTLRAAIAALPEDRPRTLIFSCLRDKNLLEMARILFPLFDSSLEGDVQRNRDRLILTVLPNPRSAKMDELLAAAVSLGVPAHAAESPVQALELASSLTPEDGIIVATGSVYLIGELRIHADQCAEVTA